MQADRSAWGFHRWLPVWLLCCALTPAFAGNQAEEQLADQVRIALARAITEPRPPQLRFATDADRTEWQRWFAMMSTQIGRAHV